MILPAIAKGGRTVRRITEGAVVARGVFDRVAHDARIDKARGIKPRTDSGNASIHHVGRCNDVRPRTRLTDGCLNEVRQGSVIVYIMIVQLTAVTVCRILAEADIADNEQLRNGLLDRRNRTLHRACHIPRT